MNTGNHTIKVVKVNIFFTHKITHKRTVYNTQYINIRIYMQI